MELNDILLKIADRKQKNKVFELVLFGNLLNPLGTLTSAQVDIIYLRQ